jgi:hypothetical protein
MKYAVPPIRQEALDAAAAAYQNLIDARIGYKKALELALAAGCKQSELCEVTGVNSSTMSKLVKASYQRPKYHPNEWRHLDGKE